MTVSPDLDHRFREAAASEGLLDVGFDVVESPIGALLVAASDRGLCRIFFDAEPWVFTVCYTAFGLLVAATWWFAPPRRPWAARTGTVPESMSSRGTPRDLGVQVRVDS